MSDKEYLAELERVDSLKSERDTAIKRAQVAEGERDSLAAHVERLRPFVERLNNLCFHDEGSKAGVEEALSDTPTISLTRLKAQWQAEALEKLYSESQGSMIVARGSLVDEARRLRRQAEADK